MLFALLIACQSAEPTDSGSQDPKATETGGNGTTTTDPDPTDTCAYVGIEYIGPDKPVVGDEWTVFLKCDGVSMFGVTVIQPEPSTLASIDVNVLTFEHAGHGSIFMQVGGYSDEIDVTVGLPD